MTGHVQDLSNQPKVEPAVDTVNSLNSCCQRNSNKTLVVYKKKQKKTPNNSSCQLGSTPLSLQTDQLVVEQRAAWRAGTQRKRRAKLCLSCS